MSDLSPDGIIVGHISETGWEPPVGGINLEQWKQNLQLVGRVSKALRWVCVDVYMYGERKFGEVAAQYAESIGWSPQTLLNAISVWRAFPPETRNGDLSFGHHDACVGLTPAERIEVMTKAVANGWSVQTLRAEVRARKGKELEPSLAEVGDRLAEAVSEFLHQLGLNQRLPGADPPPADYVRECVRMWRERRAR